MTCYRCKDEEGRFCGWCGAPRGRLSRGRSGVVVGRSVRGMPPQWKAAFDRLVHGGIDLPTAVRLAHAWWQTTSGDKS